MEGGEGHLVQPDASACIVVAELPKPQLGHASQRLAIQPCWQPATCTALHRASHAMSANT